MARALKMERPDADEANTWLRKVKHFSGKYDRLCARNEILIEIQTENAMTVAHQDPARRSVTDLLWNPCFGVAFCIMSCLACLFVLRTDIDIYS